MNTYDLWPILAASKGDTILGMAIILGLLAAGLMFFFSNTLFEDIDQSPDDEDNDFDDRFIYGR